MKKNFEVQKLFKFSNISNNLCFIQQNYDSSIIRILATDIISLSVHLLWKCVNRAFNSNELTPTCIWVGLYLVHNVNILRAWKYLERIYCHT